MSCRVLSLGKICLCMVLLLLSEALGFNGINVIVLQCLAGFFCSKEIVGAQRYNVRTQNIQNLNILLNMDKETKY
jgi:hypothetical protein